MELAIQIDSSPKQTDGSDLITIYDVEKVLIELRENHAVWKNIKKLFLSTREFSDE